MYKKPQFKRTSINHNDSMEGAPIEVKIERIINNKEAITDGAPIIFTERNEGVLQAYNIRTDRFEVALDGIDKIQKSYAARREENMNKVLVVEKENNGKTEPTQGTET